MSHRKRKRNMSRNRAVEWTHRPDGWVEVRVEFPHYQPMSVVGYAEDGVPATPPGLLLPGEERVAVKPYFHPTYFRAAVPDFREGERELARGAIHSLRAWYGFRPCSPSPNACSCDLELGPFWRWFQACDAHVVSTAMAATKIAA